ncbi:hypothetical protein KBD59_03450 [Candidatus Gracilibacteria bacterium]|nr:hypothetical protein [Candidatus Gracilibacteria bacterium]
MNVPVAIIVVFLGVLILLFVLLSKRGKLTRLQHEFISSQWKSIARLSVTDPSKSIIEADKLLDWALRRRGYKGTLGEKLKKSEKLFADRINDIWFAHKLRNGIVHEVGYSLKPHDARRALAAFEDALHRL